jgi:glutaredoxin-related protein
MTQDELSRTQARFDDIRKQRPLLLFLEGQPDKHEDETGFTTFVIEELRGMKAKWGFVNVLEDEHMRQWVAQRAGSEEFPLLLTDDEFLCDDGEVSVPACGVWLAVVNANVCS